MGTDTAKRQILVTGSSGFIGTHLTAGLAFSKTLKCSITGLDIKPSFMHTEILDRFHQSDVMSYMKKLNDAYNLKSLFPEQESYDYIVHLASISSPQIFNSLPADSIISDLAGLLSILTYCRHHPKTKLVLVSTASSAEKDFFDTSKSMMEELVEMFAKKFKFSGSIIRLHEVFGPGDTDYSPYNSLLSACKIAKVHNEYLILNTPQSHKRDWVHISTVVEGIISVMLEMDEAKKSKVYKYEIGSGESTSVKDLIQSFGLFDEQIIQEETSPASDIHANPQLFPKYLKERYELGAPSTSIIEYVGAWIEDGCPLD